MWEQAWYDLRDSGAWRPDEAAFFHAIGGTADDAVTSGAAGVRPPGTRPSDTGSARAQLGHVDEAWKAVDVRAPARVFVTVGAGDTLGGIAKAHALSLAALLAFTENRPYRPNSALNHPGDRVRVT